MQTMTRETWTDERLDDLNEKVDRGFAHVDARFNRFEARVDARFDKLDERFYALNCTLLAGMIVIIAALLGAIFT